MFSTLDLKIPDKDRLQEHVQYLYVDLKMPDKDRLQEHVQYS